ncbi:hypothetical protein RI367_007390 [Sorochytrium milnesiophthora]
MADHRARALSAQAPHAPRSLPAFLPRDDSHASPEDSQGFAAEYSGADGGCSTPGPNFGREYVLQDYSYENDTVLAAEAEQLLGSMKLYGDEHEEGADEEVFQYTSRQSWAAFCQPLMAKFVRTVTVIVCVVLIGTVAGVGLWAYRRLTPTMVSWDGFTTFDTTLARHIFLNITGIAEGNVRFVVDDSVPPNVIRTSCKILVNDDALKGQFYLGQVLEEQPRGPFPGKYWNYSIGMPSQPSWRQSPSSQRMDIFATIYFSPVFLAQQPADDRLVVVVATDKLHIDFDLSSWPFASISASSMNGDIRGAVLTSTLSTNADNGHTDLVAVIAPRLGVNQTAGGVSMQSSNGNINGLISIDDQAAQASGGPLLVKAATNSGRLSVSYTVPDTAISSAAAVFKDAFRVNFDLSTLNGRAVLTKTAAPRLRRSISPSAATEWSRPETRTSLMGQMVSPAADIRNITQLAFGASVDVQMACGNGNVELTLQ